MPRRRAASARVPASSIACRRSTLPGPRAISSPWKTRRRGRTAFVRAARGYDHPSNPTGERTSPCRIGRPEMWMPLLLFGLFTLLSVGGAYVVASRFRGRKAGVLAALPTALFFGAVLFGVLALIREGRRALEVLLHEMSDLEYELSRAGHRRDLLLAVGGAARPRLPGGGGDRGGDRRRALLPALRSALERSRRRAAPGPPRACRTRGRAAARAPADLLRGQGRRRRARGGRAG